MASTYTANTLIKVDARGVSNTGVGVTSDVRVQEPSPIADTAWLNGTGAGQLTKVWKDVRDYNDTGTELDLTSLSAANSNGNVAAAFNSYVVLVVKNNSSNTSCIVGAAASNSVNFGQSDVANTTVTIKAGETKVLAHDRTSAGYVCTTARKLKVASASNSVNTSVTVVVGGRD